MWSAVLEWITKECLNGGDGDSMAVGMAKKWGLVFYMTY